MVSRQLTADATTVNTGTVLPACSDRGARLTAATSMGATAYTPRRTCYIDASAEAVRERHTQISRCGKQMRGIRRCGGLTCHEAAAIELLEGVERPVVEHMVHHAPRVDGAVLEVQVPQRRGVPWRRAPRSRRRRPRRRRKLLEDAACDVQCVVVVLRQVVCMEPAPACLSVRPGQRRGSHKRAHMAATLSGDGVCMACMRVAVAMRARCAL